MKEFVKSKYLRKTFPFIWNVWEKVDTLARYVSNFDFAFAFLNKTRVGIQEVQSTLQSHKISMRSSLRVYTSCRKLSSGSINNLFLCSFTRYSFFVKNCWLLTFSLTSNAFLTNKTCCFIDRILCVLYHFYHITRCLFHVFLMKTWNSIHIWNG